jgi:hypothetical protein
MSISSIHNLPLGGVHPNGPVQPVPPVTSSPEVKAHVDMQTTLLNPPPGSKFAPTEVFNHLVNLEVRVVAKNTTLPQRRQRSDRKSTNNLRVGTRTSASSVKDEAQHDADDGKRMQPVEQALNLLWDDSGRGRRQILDDELESQGYDPLQRFNIYLEAAQNMDNAELARQDVRRIKVALKSLMADIFRKKRHEIRRLLHDEEELEAAITAILGSQDSAIASVTRRELRGLFAPARARMQRDRVDIPLRALSLLRCLIRNAGMDGCLLALPAYRAFWKSGY